MEKIAKLVFDAWQEGEKTGNYDHFKSYLSEKFVLFSHPLMGKYAHAEALNAIKNLIKEREQNSNALLFSEVSSFKKENAVLFQFNSKGTVQNGSFSYEGFNIILLAFDQEVFTGFQEYFGFIDPNWFKK